jgi:hypothetical protein
MGQIRGTGASARNAAPARCEVCQLPGGRALGNDICVNAIDVTSTRQRYSEHQCLRECHRAILWTREALLRDEWARSCALL